MPARKRARRKTARRKVASRRRKVASKKRGASRRKTARRKTARRKPARRKTARRKTARRKTARRKTARRKPARKKASRRRRPNAAFMKPMMPSMVLAQVIGSRAMPRTEVTKRLWAYIKRNRLQDKVKRTMINADDKLRAVFGGKRQVSMFEMTKLVSRHLK